MNFYETLGVPPDVSPEELKKAYRRAASEAHPDRKGGSTIWMSAINQAYETLSDPNKRAHYDKTGEILKEIDPGVREALLTAFNAALMSGDVRLAVAETQIRTKKYGLQKSISMLDTERKRQEGVRNKIRTKPNVRNFFHYLIDTRIVEIDDQIKRARENIEYLDLALEALKDYEGDDGWQALDDYLTKTIYLSGGGAQ